MAANTLLDANDIALLLDIANFACHKQLPGEAREIVDGVLAVDPDFPPARIALAFTHLVVDEFDQALALLDAVLGQNPNDADALVLQGMAYSLAGKTEEANRAFDAIPEDAPQRALANEWRRSV